MIGFIEKCDKHWLNLRNSVRHSWNSYCVLLRSVPSVVMSLFVVSVILMNLLANKEIDTGVSWLALDCGLTVSWMSFLAMDIITKHFGPKASIQLSATAIIINLAVCIMMFLIAKLPGNWAQFYTFENETVNQALDNTFGGTWYILLGSTLAFFAASCINSIINAIIGVSLKSDNFKTYAIRSYVSTFFGQFVDNFVFAYLVSHVFFGWTLLQCVMCSLTGCIVELLCEVIFSPFGYRISKNWAHKNVGTEYFRSVSK